MLPNDTYKKFSERFASIHMAICLISVAIASMPASAATQALIQPLKKVPSRIAEPAAHTPHCENLGSSEGGELIERLFSNIPSVKGYNCDDCDPTIALGYFGCTYAYEQRALRPDFYDYCASRKAQLQLEYIAPGTVRAFLQGSGRCANVGNDDLGVKQCFYAQEVAVTSAASDDQQLLPFPDAVQTKSRLVFRLLGHDLPIFPPQRVSVDMRTNSPVLENPEDGSVLQVRPNWTELQNGKPTLELSRLPVTYFFGNAPVASWLWETMDLGVYADIPIPSIGNFGVGLKAEKFHPRSVAFLSDRSTQYSSIGEQSDFSAALGRHDWDWYREPSYAFGPFATDERPRAGTSYDLMLVSPSVVPSINDFDFLSLRFKGQGSFKGTWNHQDRYEMVPPYYPPDLIVHRILSSDPIAVRLKFDASLVATLEILWFRTVIEFPIFESDPVSNEALLNESDFTVAEVKFKGIPLDPCSNAATVAEPPMWANENVPDVVPDPFGHAPVNLVEYLTPVVETVRDRFYLCDSRGQPWSEDVINRLESLVEQSKPESMSCDDAKRIIKKHAYVCDAKCPVEKGLFSSTKGCPSRATSMHCEASVHGVSTTIE